MGTAILLAIVAYAALGVIVGLLSGLLGIGGGVVMVPVLHLLCGKDMHVAVGTSLAAMVVGALAGAARHAGFQNVDWLVAAGLGVGTVTGAYVLGAPLAEQLPADTLRKLFGVLMFLFGLRMMGVFAWISSWLAR